MEPVCSPPIPLLPTESVRNNRPEPNPEMQLSDQWRQQGLLHSSFHGRGFCFQFMRYGWRHCQGNPLETSAEYYGRHVDSCYRQHNPDDPRLLDPPQTCVGWVSAYPLSRGGL